MVANTLINARDLVKLVLADLDVTFARHLDQKMLVKIYRTHIKTAHAAGRTIVIAIDEAQNLDPDVLRSLKDLQVAADGSPLPVKIILSGQLALSEHILAAQLLTVAGLKARSCQLKPLSSGEVDRYLHYRTSVAGNKRRIFQNESLLWLNSNGRFRGGTPGQKRECYYTYYPEVLNIVQNITVC